MARLVAKLVCVSCAFAIIVPSGASAWKYVFQDFFANQQGATGAAFAVAKKCTGGKLGYYDFVSRAGGYSNDPDNDIQIELEAELPVLPKFKPLRKQKLQVETGDNFDPAVTAEIVDAYGRFFDGIEAKWSPGEITFRHPELVVFGNQILSEGKHLEDFKPKDKC